MHKAETPTGVLDRVATFQLTRQAKNERTVNIMKIKHDNGYGTTYIFEVVEKIPYSYEVWNINEIGSGEYIPICQSVDCNVNVKTLKAIKLSKEEVAILSKAASAGIKTVSKAKITLSRVAKTAYAKENQRRAEKALPILERITA